MAYLSGEDIIESNTDNIISSNTLKFGRGRDVISLRICKIMQLLSTCNYSTQKGFTITQLASVVKLHT